MPFDLKREKRGWKVVDADGKEYSRKPLTKKRATAQLRALYSAESRGEFKKIKGGYVVKHEGEEHKLMYGEGFFSDVFDKVKRFAVNQIDLLKRVPPIRRDYPPNVRTLLSQYGEGLIVGLTIRREPIQSFINKALNYITSGKWDKAKRDANYDNMFHLSLVADVKMGSDIKRILIEKNEVINMTTNFSTTAKQTLFPLETPVGLKLLELMNRTRQRMGDSNFFLYDAFTNNCQNFVLNLVESAGVMTPEARQFILQPVEDLVKNLPSYTPFITRAVTDLGALANRVVYGEGACCEKCAMGKACLSGRGGAPIVVGGKRLKSIYIGGAEPFRTTAEEQKDLLKSEGIEALPSTFKKPEELVKREWESEEKFEGRKARVGVQNRRMEHYGITPADQQRAILEDNIKRLEADIKAIEASQAVQKAFDEDPRTIAKLAEIADKKKKNEFVNKLNAEIRGLYDKGKEFLSSNPKAKMLIEVNESILRLFGASPADDEERERRREEIIRKWEERKRFGEEYASRLGSQLIDMRLKLKGMKDGLKKFELANKETLSAKKKFVGRDATGKPIYEGGGPAGSKPVSPNDALRTEALGLLAEKRRLEKTISDWERLRTALEDTRTTGLKPTERETKAKAVLSEMYVEYGKIDTAKIRQIEESARSASERIGAVRARLSEIARSVQIREDEVVDWASGRKRGKGRKLKGGILEVRAHPAGAGWLVVDGNQQVAGPFDTREEAEAELARREGRRTPPPAPRREEPPPPPRRRRPPPLVIPPIDEAELRERARRRRRVGMRLAFDDDDDDEEKTESDEAVEEKEADTDETSPSSTSSEEEKTGKRKRKGGMRLAPAEAFEGYVTLEEIPRELSNVFTQREARKTFKKILDYTKKFGESITELSELLNEEERAQYNERIQSWLSKNRKYRRRVKALYETLLKDDIPSNPDQRRTMDTLLTEYDEINDQYNELHQLFKSLQKDATLSPGLKPAREDDALAERRRREALQFQQQERFEASGSGSITEIVITDEEGRQTIVKRLSKDETNEQIRQRANATVRRLRAEYELPPMSPIEGKGVSMRQMAGGSILAQLKKLKVPKTKYLNAIREAGKAKGYDPKKILLSDDGEHKIMVVDDTGKKHYAGRVGYGDFHIWGMLEGKRDVPSGTASQKQKDYLARATKIKGNWKKDKYSPNSLAIALLW